MFYFAQKLSKQFNTPWIADYRDPWTTNEKRSPNLFLKKWNNFVERKLLKSATCITTVSEFVKTLVQANQEQYHFTSLPTATTLK